MRLRKPVLSVLGFTAVGVAITLWLIKEPSYQGRSLSSWLEMLVGSDLKEVEKATAAIKAMGHKAVPHLAGMVLDDYSSIDRFLREVDLPKVVANVGRRKFSPDEVRRFGVAGLSVLGPDASGAVPEVVRALKREPDKIELWFLLEKIGKESIAAAPILTRLLPNEKENDSDFSIDWVGSDLFMTWGGPHRDTLEGQLLAQTNSLRRRVSSVWALRKDSDFARRLLPVLSEIIADPNESTTLRKACLHAVGRIPEVEERFIRSALEAYERDFAPLPEDRLSNGDFADSDGVDRTEGNGFIAPTIVIGDWVTWAGVIGRNLGSANDNRMIKVELGPRTPPGAISQVFRTTPGKRYELSFQAASGRNLRGHVSIGDLDKMFIPAGGEAQPTRFAFEFRARSVVTTLTFSAVGFEAYGPFIDDITVRMK